jgi:hypothetical protein
MSDISSGVVATGRSADAPHFLMSGYRQMQLRLVDGALRDGGASIEIFVMPLQSGVSF